MKLDTKEVHNMYMCLKQYHSVLTFDDREMTVLRQAAPQC